MIIEVDHKARDIISQSLPDLNTSTCSDSNRCPLVKKKARKVRQIRNGPKLEMIEVREEVNLKSSWVSEMQTTMMELALTNPFNVLIKRLFSEAEWALSEGSLCCYGT